MLKNYCTKNVQKVSEYNQEVPQSQTNPQHHKEEPQNTATIQLK